MLGVLTKYVTITKNADSRTNRYYKGTM